MMITPSDKDYKVTKQIKQGTLKMNPDFVELADWINSNFNVNVINILYDTIDNIKNRPRLTVIFEWHKDEVKFRDGAYGNFNSEKQNLIGDKFEQLVKGNKENQSFFDKFLNRSSDLKYKRKDLWVVFTSFEPIAKDEANSRVPESDVKKLKKELNNKDLWEISRAFSGTTFFLHTDKQVKEYENSEIRKTWTSKYFDLLDQYNEFGYFKRDSFSIYLDSKENFDKNYESNWFYYYK